MGELIKRFWESLILPLMNERGEVDPDPDPELEPGDPEPEPEPGDPEPEPEPAEPADPDPALIDPEPEPEPDPVPYARFKEVHTKSKDLEQKFDQFKRLGEEGYYKLYPDERPAGDPKPEPEPEPKEILSASEMANHRITGGEYDGMTLGEVMKEDPLVGMDIYNAYKADEEGKKVSDARLREESEQEVQTFISARAKEGFGKERDDLTKEEAAQVEELSNTVTQWMVDTGRGGGNIEDGYYLMNKGNFFDDAKHEALKGLIEALKTPGTASISAGKTEPAGTGYTRFLNMTPDQVKVELDKLTDAENVEFLKKAPAEVRKKFPSLPWDDA